MTDPVTDHARALGILARCDAARLKAFAEPLIARLGEIQVLENRTGLVMLPMRDTAQGTHFHLGEVLMSEAHIAASGTEGFGMRRGRDLEAAMAMAVVDACLATGQATAPVRSFLDTEARHLAEADRDRLCQVEATRVNMETF
ncbi:MAG: phosphonate C-P lyase system protein PhnG [Silicimonas sp.]|nr:phosphonate C-P lyase system protein PhnG [Silicimonas sp.]